MIFGCFKSHLKLVLANLGMERNSCKKVAELASLYYRRDLLRTPVVSITYTDFG